MVKLNILLQRKIVIKGKLPACALPGLCTAGKSRTLPDASPERLVL